MIIAIAWAAVLAFPRLVFLTRLARYVEELERSTWDRPQREEKPKALRKPIISSYF